MLHEELVPEIGCKVCAYLRTLKQGEAAEWRLELALPVEEVGNTAVVRALARRGVHISESSVRRHRTRHHAV